MQREKPNFLHFWARQLLKEHDFICRSYRLKLSRPVIEIIDVSSYWGKWIAETGTISLAQSLVSNQSWDVVINVLKHEMAHQLTDEMAGAGGHGTDFRRNCDLLGVPAPFRQASGTITGLESADSGQRSTDRDRILKKIRKILALTESSNMHESLLAMQKARQLLDRHNLKGEFNGDAEDQSYSNLLINLKRKRVECYHRAIYSLLLDFFHIEIVITPQYDAHDLTTYKCLDLLGKTGNVKIAGYVYHFLMERLPALWHAHQKSTGAPKNGRNSYWLGVLNGFREGLANDRRAGEESQKMAPAKQAALLPVAPNDPAIRSFVASRYPKLKTGRKRSARVDPLRFEAGLKDGLLLKLRKGLQTGGEEQRLLPPAAIPEKC